MRFSGIPQNSRLTASDIEGFDVVIHLSGENISGRRWSPGFKKKILNSRVDSTRLLAKVISQLNNPPKLFACASATGFYGDQGEKQVTETSPPGSGFLTEVVLRWEEAAQALTSAGIRTIFLRFGVVLSPSAGALKILIPIFKMGLGGKIGSGKQYMPWISVLEIPAILEFIIANDKLNGPVNMVSPNPVTNARFTKTLSDVLHRPAFMNVPASILKLTMGQMAEELLLTSTNVIPKKLTDAGYRFQYPELDNALSRLLDRSYDDTM